MPVHTNSRTLTIRATKAPWLALSPRPAADIRKQYCRHKCASVLIAQSRNLTVDGVELLTVLVDKAGCPLAQAGNPAEQTEGTTGKALAIAHYEEPQTEHAERRDGCKQSTHKDVERTHHKVKRHGQKPEPKMTEDVGHGKEYDRRRRPFGANDWRERHYAVWLAAHQSARRGIV